MKVIYPTANVSVRFEDLKEKKPSPQFARTCSLWTLWSEFLHPRRTEKPSLFIKNSEFSFAFLETWGIFQLSTVENGDSVIPMLSDRSFDMQKQCPILPHREREKSPF